MAMTTSEPNVACCQTQHRVIRWSDAGRTWAVTRHSGVAPHHVISFEGDQAPYAFSSVRMAAMLTSSAFVLAARA